MPYVNSSAIRRIEYDPLTEILSIWFVDTGGPYDYFGVPYAVFEGLLNASSKGRYFNDRIRDRYSAR